MSGVLRRNPSPWILAGILVGAFVFRVGAAVWLQHDLDVHKQRPYLIMGDAEGYWDLGLRIAQGKPYELYDPPRRVERMPGYPAFVAIAVRLSEALGIPGRDHFVARLLMAGVGTLACGLVALLGTQLFDPRIGLLAAAITAIAPPLVGFSVVLLTETLFAAAMLASLCCMAQLVQVSTSQDQSISKDQRGRRLTWAALTGVSIAAAVYVRPSWLLAAPCFAVLLAICLIRGGMKLEALGMAAIVIGCTFAALFPWAARNHSVTGHWVFTTLWVGPSLYDGFNPQATGDSNMHFFDADRDKDRLSEYRVDRLYRERAWNFIVQHPRRVLELTFAKLARYWMPWPNAENMGGLAGKIAVAVYFIPAVIAAIVGWLTGPRSFWGWTLTLGPILYLSVIHAIFLGSLRYRLPAEYALCVASAVGLREGWRRIWHRRAHSPAECC